MQLLRHYDARASPFPPQHITLPISLASSVTCACKQQFRCSDSANRNPNNKNRSVTQPLTIALVMQRPSAYRPCYWWQARRRFLPGTRWMRMRKTFVAIDTLLSPILKALVPRLLNEHTSFTHYSKCLTFSVCAVEYPVACANFSPVVPLQPGLPS
jgi:hypothetical protein